MNLFELNDDINNIIYEYVLNNIENNIYFLEYILTNIKIKNTNTNTKMFKNYKLFQVKARMFNSNRMFK